MFNLFSHKGNINLSYTEILAHPQSVMMKPGRCLIPVVLAAEKPRQEGCHELEASWGY